MPVRPACQGARRNPAATDSPAPFAGRYSVMERGVMPKEMIHTAPESPGKQRGCPVFVGWSVELAEVRIATLDSATLHDGPGTGFYSLLDRQQLNRLIRILRRARDAAYGRDE